MSERSPSEARFYSSLARRIGWLRLHAESAVARARVLELAERGSNRKALNRIEVFERRWKAFDPAADLPLRLLLIKGYLHGVNKEDGQAIEILAKACQMIEEAEGLDPNEKEYLLCYASVCALRSVRRMRLPNTLGFRVEFDRVSLDVSPSLKRHYPLRQHPQWQGP